MIWKGGSKIENSYYMPKKYCQIYYNLLIKMVKTSRTYSIWLFVLNPFFNVFCCIIITKPNFYMTEELFYSQKHKSAVIKKISHIFFLFCVNRILKISSIFIVLNVTGWTWYSCSSMPIFFHSFQMDLNYPLKTFAPSQPFNGAI